MTDNTALVARAQEYLVEKYSPKGNRTGWLMIASIFVEAWDLFAMSFILIFIQHTLHAGSQLEFTLAAAAPQLGAAIGALLGGWLTDVLGRRTVFLGTMISFIVFGLAQAFVPTAMTLAFVRFLLGLPLGADIASGYAYIMETVKRGNRDVMGNRWQMMWALGELVGALAAALLYKAGMDEGLLWRVMLGFGAVPAAVIFALRWDLPETALWLVSRGRFREAKRVSLELYGDPLDFLPDEDLEVPRVRLSDFLTHVWRDAVRKRATIYAWIASVMQSLEFATFSFYLPVIFSLLKLGGLFQVTLMTAAVYVVALVSGIVGPAVTPRLGQRGLSLAGFGLATVGLIIAGLGQRTGALVLVPIGAAVMMWGHYWDSENIQTIPTSVAEPRYRGMASGFSYLFVKVPYFFGLWFFPIYFGALGKTNASFGTAVFSLIGFLSALWILPETFGFAGESATGKTAAGTAASQ